MEKLPFMMQTGSRILVVTDILQVVLMDAKDLVALEPKTCMQQVPNDEQKLVKDVLDKLN